MKLKFTFLMLFVLAAGMVQAQSRGSFTGTLIATRPGSGGDSEPRIFPHHQIVAGLEALENDANGMKDIELDPDKGSINQSFIQVHPNPAISSADIAFWLENDDVATVRVFNAMGVEVFPTETGAVKNTHLYALTLDVTSVEQGMYFAVVTTESGVKLTSKFMVLH